jgi:GTP diphosphokinase / guanosine-3',5'-bis(diphosphate) 3'-diphosphatase
MSERVLESHRGGVLAILPGRRRLERGELESLARSLREHHPKADLRLVQRGYEVAARFHEGQLRKSGDPYIVHPLGVAKIVAELGFDDITITAALLHDVVEDSEAGLTDIEEAFGGEIAELVDGVTKLERLHFSTKEQQQAATFRKMILAMAKDLRVLVIKLADRLHNMQTIAPLSPWKQQRTAQETLDVYAPLAHRLGMQEVKWRLEDLSFAVLHPKRYGEIEQMVAERAPANDAHATEVVGQLEKMLKEARISAEVSGRTKHYYSIYEKMVLDGKDFDEIYDLVGVRVIVQSVRDCYAALGTVHSLWRPVSGRFKDFIAMPKFNLYQSLHTTLVGPFGRAVEVQIRTPPMHQTAEFGVAAHWAYKDRRRGSHHPEDDRLWLSGMIDWSSETADAREFLEQLRIDLSRDEVYVLTPKGDVLALPTGATPVDFAYAIHTEVGNRCVGAKVNGRLLSLDSPLQSGDAVEVVTSKAPDAGPSRDWLRFVVSSKASSKIRQWFSRERREDAIEEGRDRLWKALRKMALPVQKVAALDLVDKAGHELNYQSADAVYAALGEGHLSVTSFAQRVARLFQPPAVEPDELARLAVRRRERPLGGVGVNVEGRDDVLARLARCCSPLPGDPLIGYVTRGSGVSVHRSDCTNAMALAGQPERLVEVEWDVSSTAPVAVAIQVEALDRPRLLRDVSAVLSDAHVNILACTTSTGSDRIATQRFEFELADPEHLDRVLAELKRIDSVYDAYRVVPGIRHE